MSEKKLCPLCGKPVKLHPGEDHEKAKVYHWDCCYKANKESREEYQEMKRKYQ